MAIVRIDAQLLILVATRRRRRLAASGRWLAALRRCHRAHPRRCHGRLGQEAAKRLRLHLQLIVGVLELVVVILYVRVLLLVVVSIEPCRLDVLPDHLRQPRHLALAEEPAETTGALVRFGPLRHCEHRRTHHTPAKRAHEANCLCEVVLGLKAVVSKVLVSPHSTGLAQGMPRLDYEHVLGRAEVWAWCGGTERCGGCVQDASDSRWQPRQPSQHPFFAPL